MKRVYEIQWRGYKYATGPGVDWVMGDLEEKTVVADNSLSAVRWIRSQTTYQIEIQSIRYLCEVDHVVEGD